MKPYIRISPQNSGVTVALKSIDLKTFLKSDVSSSVGGL